MFVDQVKITVQACNGGDGCCSFRREKFIPKGGPDGGDGGKGGDVVFRAFCNVSTHLDLRYHQLYRADHGIAGSWQLKTGKSGKDCVIQVPVGTVVRDHETRNVLADLTEDSQEFVIGRG